MRRTGDEKGYTMLETIMYIGFIGMLGTVLAGYVGTVFQRYKTGRIAQQIIDLKKAVVNFTAADEDYSALTLEKMDKSNSLPLDMRGGHHALSGSFDLGPVGAGTETATMNDKYLFYITFNAVYQGACIELLTQGQFYGDGSDMDTLIVNNKTAWNYERSFYDAKSIATVHTMKSQAGAAVGIRPAVEDVLKACDSQESNSITWIFS